jgi:hypothetical protein
MTDPTYFVKRMRVHLGYVISDICSDLAPAKFFLIAGNIPWNITTSKNGDKLTAGPDDPGLVNFPSLNPPPAVGGQGIDAQNFAVVRSRARWSLSIFGLASTLLLA